MIFQKKQTPFLLFVHKIWDHADSNAMPSLIYFKDYWICALIESSHLLENQGIIRIIFSRRGKEWTPIHVFADPSTNYLNPQLSLMPNNQLMLLVEGMTYNSLTKEMDHRSYVSFSQDGFEWSTLQPILEPNQWIWHLIWQGNQVFALANSNKYPQNENHTQQIDFLFSQNGLKYLWVTSLEIPKNSKDGAIAFYQGRMIALFSGDKESNSYPLLGMSLSPFYQWNWLICQYWIRKLALINIADEQLWAVGSLISSTPYGSIEKMTLIRVTLGALLEPALILPGSGKIGRPSLFSQDQEISICYTSSYEGKTAVYLAKVNIMG